MPNDQFIWGFLKKEGFNDYGAAGLMGNLYAESGLLPNNLQNTFNSKLGLSDEEVMQVFNKIIEYVTSKLNCSVRDNQEILY